MAEIINKIDLTDLLYRGTVDVCFTKQNGERRNMRCTLHEDYLPPFDRTVTRLSKTKPEGLMTVWDIDNDGWRSFNLDSILSVTWVG